MVITITLPSVVQQVSFLHHSTVHFDILLLLILLQQRQLPYICNIMACNEIQKSGCKEHISAASNRKVGITTSLRDVVKPKKRCQLQFYNYNSIQKWSWSWSRCLYCLGLHPSEYCFGSIVARNDVEIRQNAVNPLSTSARRDAL